MALNHSGNCRFGRGWRLLLHQRLPEGDDGITVTNCHHHQITVSQNKCLADGFSDRFAKGIGLTDCFTGNISLTNRDNLTNNYPVILNH